MLLLSPPSCSGILPVLKPIFEQADGEVLLALIKHLAVFYNLMPRCVCVSRDNTAWTGAQHTAAQQHRRQLGAGLLL